MAIKQNANSRKDSSEQQDDFSPKQTINNDLSGPLSDKFEYHRDQEETETKSQTNQPEQDAERHVKEVKQTQIIQIVGGDEGSSPMLYENQSKDQDIMDL